MDTIEQIKDIFAETEKMCLTDVQMLDTLAKCIDHYGKFRIQINGFKGKVGNLNIQIKTGKNTWLHVSKNYYNRDGDNQKAGTK